MRRVFAVLVFAWLGVAPAFGAATRTPTTNYEVEVLVFEIGLPEHEGSELWTQVTQLPDISKAQAPAELPPTKDFAAAADALRADGRYRVLLQKRWVQSAEPRSSEPGVWLTTPEREVDGTLKFYLSRFLHVDVNLLFQPQAGVIGGDGAPSYLISEQRRIRSNEINYFDHPKFGVLVRVAPVRG